MLWSCTISQDGCRPNSTGVASLRLLQPHHQPAYEAVWAGQRPHAQHRSEKHQRSRGKETENGLEGGGAKCLIPFWWLHWWQTLCVQSYHEKGIHLSVFNLYQEKQAFFAFGFSSHLFCWIDLFTRIYNLRYSRKFCVKSILVYFLPALLLINTETHVLETLYWAFSHSMGINPNCFCRWHVSSLWQK